MRKLLTLKILSPAGRYPEVSCDSVHLVLSDDDMGRGGGSCGIRSGHAKAILALDKGAVTAFADGKSIFELKLSGGFATVDNDIVTVVAEKII